MNIRSALGAAAVMASAGAMPIPNFMNQTEWLGGVLWSRMKDLEPPPSLVKCLGATLAGSIFALLGMFLESLRDRKKKEHISRDELRNLIPNRPRSQSMTDGASQSQRGAVDVGKAGSSPMPAASNGTSSHSGASARLRSGMSRSLSSPSGATSAPATPCAPSGTAPRKDSSPFPEGLRSPGSQSWRPSRSYSTPSAPAPTRRAPAALGQGGRVLSEIEQAERQVKIILNKMTRDKFNTLYAQIIECCKTACTSETNRAEIVEVVAREAFAMATRQHTFVELYADLCQRLHADLEKEKIPVNFKRVLLDQCQQSFKSYLEPPQIDKLLDYEEHYEQLVKFKTKMLGNVKLIGCLLRRAMLSPKIIFHCTDELLSIGSDESLETLCVFLDTIGTTFDSAEWQGRPRLEEVFTRVELLTEDDRKSSRIRCLLKDLLDKRRSNWRDFSGRPKAR